MAIAGAGRLAWPAEILSRSLMLMLVLVLVRVLMSTPGPEVCSRISKTATATFRCRGPGREKDGEQSMPPAAEGSSLGTFQYIQQCKVPGILLFLVPFKSTGGSPTRASPVGICG
jgi:hypothetical protein